ncbi:triosephosphate isomerase [Ectothiorhodosinus mongolicus]|uniref:Triosephosphate isomerase n=1 Tax=Ectothiorhodosinus mongolicus TaxID=233100 RepID=A0A1R3VNY0_9GAMM|nr:triose-phosphate isomerase [Ectothiorhodosinus mongolicus]ULX56534.1 triose-phosphate isomerase [Ectothiorhodosinus mongolicus]SIT66246.1 triosephosphate isomerase [Ectothiorhodosinus mongolicus]
MRQALVAGNWKMHGGLKANAVLMQELVDGVAALDRVDVSVCPPFVYVPQVSQCSGDKIALGAQNLATEVSGAFTGEVSGEMLKELGCAYVIVGHSERRTLYGEDDDCVAVKFARALDAGLKPILCVGESLEQRESGVTEAVISQQLDAVLERSDISAFAQAVIAYEPVWAIGTGRTASPEQAQAVHAHIRQRLAKHDAKIAAQIQILYGGSVKPDNAAELFQQADIDGGLIGGASLKAADFLAICRAAQQAG